MQKVSDTEREAPAEARESEEARSTNTRDRYQPACFDPLRIYLGEIRRYPLLSREDEVDLAIRYREKGDSEAAYKLITANLRLVVKIAMDLHQSRTRNLMDLIQESNVAICARKKRSWKCGEKTHHPRCSAGGSA